MSIKYIYIDGSSVSNPSVRGGYSVILCDKQKQIILIYANSITENKEVITNIRMELYALERAFHYIYMLNVKTKIIIYSDCKYIVDVFNGCMSSTVYLDIWIEVKEKSLKMSNVTVEWVQSHNKNTGNYIADNIAYLVTRNLTDDISSFKFRK